MMYISLFFTVTLLIYALLTVRTERRLNVKRRLALATGAEGAAAAAGEDEEEKPRTRVAAALAGRLFRPLWVALRRTFARRLPEEKARSLERLLLQAGRPLGMGPAEFRLLQLCLLLGLPAAFAAYGALLGQGIGGLLLAAVGGWATALLLPRYYLRLRARERSRKALRELPDSLDLLTVSLEAGLGFDAALNKLVSKTEGVLTAEFQRCLEEIRLGKTRREALIGVRERIDMEELKVLISSILQAEKLGIGMVQVLRVQSQEVREQRKQRAEEEAMKAPIKMLFPLVLFIFPSLFIVLLGPAVIQLIETMSKH